MSDESQLRPRVVAGSLAVQRGGVNTAAVSASDEALAPGRTPVPDGLVYLQAETELTRATLTRILTESSRLAEFFVNPQRLDERDGTKLFVKLPGWFEVDTPVGKYNPDWAIVKHDDATLYLVRETKGTRDFLKLRTSEADKVRCGARHFEAIGVDYAVVVSTGEI